MNKWEIKMQNEIIGGNGGAKGVCGMGVLFKMLCLTKVVWALKELKKRRNEPPEKQDIL